MVDLGGSCSTDMGGRCSTSILLFANVIANDVGILPKTFKWFSLNGNILMFLYSRVPFCVHELTHEHKTKTAQTKKKHAKNIHSSKNDFSAMRVKIPQKILTGAPLSDQDDAEGSLGTHVQPNRAAAERAHGVRHRSRAGLAVFDEENAYLKAALPCRSQPPPWTHQRGEQGLLPQSGVFPAVDRGTEPPEP